MYCSFRVLVVNGWPTFFVDSCSNPVMTAGGTVVPSCGLFLPYCCMEELHRIPICFCVDGLGPRDLQQQQPPPTRPAQSFIALLQRDDVPSFIDVLLFPLSLFPTPQPPTLFPCFHSLFPQTLFWVPLPRCVLEPCSHVLPVFPVPLCL